MAFFDSELDQGARPFTGTGFYLRFEPSFELLGQECLAKSQT